MTDPVLIFKLLVGSIYGLAVLSIARTSILYRIPSRCFDMGIYGWAFMSRMGVFCALFMVFGLAPQGDLPAYYYPQIAEAMRGKLIYRDFYSSYGPFFPYILVAITRIWNDLRGVILFAICLELFSLPLWMSIARNMFNEVTARRATILYLLSPIPFWCTVVSGTNQVWMSFFLALAFLFLLKRRPVVSGFVISVSMLTVKVLTLLFVPILALGTLQWRSLGGAEDRPRNNWFAAFSFLCACFLPLAVIFALLWHHGANLLTPIWWETQQVSSGNVPYLVSLFGLSPVGVFGNYYTLICVMALTGLFLWSMWNNCGDNPACWIWLSVAVLFTFMILMKKSNSWYLAIAFFPICLTIATSSFRLKDLVAFSLLGLVSILEPSLWFRWLGAHELIAIVQKGIPLIKGISFLFVELLLVSCYGYFLCRACYQLAVTQAYKVR